MKRSEGKKAKKGHVIAAHQVVVGVLYDRLLFITIYNDLDHLQCFVVVLRILLHDGS